MSLSWKQCEGQVINNTFPLEKYLGGSAESAVFLTQLSGSEPSKAAIKLVPEGPTSNLQLSLWRRAAQLSHPHLLRLLQSGRCRLADLDLLYVAMEFAEEDLAQILPDRALTSAEVRDMLGPTLSALNYLHYHGLVHSHLKPSNVLASGDQLKLSSDMLFPVGESRKSAKRDIYTAPETSSLSFTPAADAWSLGVTLVEMLTQHALDWQPSLPGDPVVPEAVPQPFAEIARRTLRVDPKQRWTMAEINACLNPVAVAAAAAQSVSPLSVPLSSVPAVPAAKLQAPRQAPPAPPPVPQAPAAPQKPTVLLPNYVLPAAAVLAILVGIFALPKILGRHPDTASSAGSLPAGSVPATSSSVPDKPITTVADAERTPAAKPISSPSVQNAEKAPGAGTPLVETTGAQTASAPAASPSSASASSASPASAPLSTENPANTESSVNNVPVETPKHSARAPRGEVLDQVLPQASEKALATITGTVRVTVLVHVDAAGSVSEAEFDSPGPSQYFANLAMTAAKRWSFTSPEVDGRSLVSEWRVRFEFKPSGVEAFPKQIAP